MLMTQKNRLNLRMQNLTAGLLAAAILGLAAYAADRWSVSWDWTRGERHTLAEQSEKAIQAFPDGLKGTVFVQENGPNRKRAEELLKKYAALNRAFAFTFVDPDLNPALARQEGIAVYGAMTLKAVDKKEKITELTEESVTNALIRLAKGTKKKILFVTGHGERAIDGRKRDAFGVVNELLQGEGYETSTVNLAEVEAIPEGTSVVILAGPRGKLFPVEVARLTTWWKKGGRLMALIDPGITTDLEPFLETQGVTLLPGLVVDPVARLFGGGPTTPLVNQFNPQHVIGENLKQAAFLPEARGLELAEAPPGEKTVRTGLFSGAERGWIENGSLEGTVTFDKETDKPGPVLLGAAVEAENARLIVVGDSDFPADASIDFAGNAELFLNMARWLAEDEDYIALKPKAVQDAGLALTPGSAFYLFYGLVIAVPLLLIGNGARIWRRRKRR